MLAQQGPTMAALANKYVPENRHQPIYSKEQALAQMEVIETEDDDVERRLDIQRIARALGFVFRAISLGVRERVRHREG